MSSHRNPTETQISFKCYSLRVIDNPISKVNNFKCYAILISIFDLPKSFYDWRKINPRDPNVHNPVSKDIRKTLREAPELFFIRNRGLTIIAKDLVFDNSSNQIILTMSDPDI